VGGSGRGGSDRYPTNFEKFGHLRLSIGLQDAEDIIADITNALDEIFGPN
jgi:methionine-gamma-lyase